MYCDLILGTGLKEKGALEIRTRYYRLQLAMQRVGRDTGYVGGRCRTLLIFELMVLLVKI